MKYSRFINECTPPLVNPGALNKGRSIVFRKELAAHLIFWKRVRGLFMVLINALGCYAASFLLSSKFHYKARYSACRIQFTGVVSTAIEIWLELFCGRQPNLFMIK